jgi:hypothetical protein
MGARLSSYNEAVVKFRAALSSEPLQSPAPRESTSNVWVYEVEATGYEAALSQAEQQWREEQHIRPGEGSTRYGVITQL